MGVVENKISIRNCRHTKIARIPNVTNGDLYISTNRWGFYYTVCKESGEVLLQDKTFIPSVHVNVGNLEAGKYFVVVIPLGGFADEKSKSNIFDIG